MERDESDPADSNDEHQLGFDEDEEPDEYDGYRPWEVVGDDEDVEWDEMREQMGEEAYAEAALRLALADPSKLEEPSSEARRRDWASFPLPPNDDMEAMMDLQDEIDRMLLEDGVVESLDTKAPPRAPSPSADDTTPGSSEIP